MLVFAFCYIVYYKDSIKSWLGLYNDLMSLVVKVNCFLNGGSAMLSLIVDINIAQKKHGPTQVIARMRKNLFGSKMSLTVAKNTMRFIGENSNAITTEVGYVIRKNAQSYLHTRDEIVKDNRCMEAMEKELKVCSTLNLIFTLNIWNFT